MEDISLLFGRLHPLLVHLPIGLLFLLIFFELLALSNKYAFLRPVLPVIAFWSMLFAIFSCIAGYLLSLSGEYEDDTLQLHKWMGISVAVANTVFYIVKKTGFASKKITIGFSLGLLVSLTIAGHLGGVLTHGEAYLNEPLMALMGGKETIKPERKPVSDINNAVVYEDLVAPVFEAKCVQCHNENKKKGGLRMDQADLLMKGGKNGAVLVAGNAMNSELFKRLHLPIEDKHRMPPKGKKQLTGQEVALIEWWIETGASLNKKVAQMPKNEKMNAFLADLRPDNAIDSGQGQKEEMEFSADKVPAVALKELAPLQALKLVVAPIDNGEPWLYVNAVNNPGLTNEQLTTLLPFRQQIAWLKLGNTQINSKALSTIAQFTHLTRLNLEHTQVDDAGIAYLKTLRHLKNLNLVGTQVTDQGLLLLAEIRSLKRIYIWQTKTSLTTVAALQKALPGCEINTGEENILSLK